MEGFGADKAGLKAGDQILAVNGSAVKESEELVKALRNYREGQTVELRVQREEKEFAYHTSCFVPDCPAKSNWHVILSPICFAGLTTDSRRI